MTSTAFRGRPEQLLQTKIVSRLRREFDCRVIHVASGGTRGRLEAVRLKEAGVEAGHPDLICYGREGRTVHLEVKAENGRLGSEQKVYISDLQGRGFPVFVVDTVEEAVQALAEAGFGPPRPADWLTRDTGGL